MNAPRASLSLFVLLCTTCDSHPPPPLDEPLGPGQARAGKVRGERELIGGPVAYGRAGDVWKLYNARVRFLVQDVGTSVGLSLYGGNLIDADLVRPGDDGKNGNDLFRETFPIVGLRVQRPTSIEVVSDGVGGGAAHLRVRGTDAPSLILPQLDDLAQELGGEIVTDYVLEPDVPYLRITTTYRAAPGQRVDPLLLGDFLSFGASLRLLTPEDGFGGTSPRVSMFGSVGDGVSYGYVYPEGTIQAPVVDASGTVAMLRSAPLPEGGELAVTRYLVVGGGDAASVMAPMYALRGAQTARLTGLVRDEAGAPVPGARVTLFPAPLAPSSTAVGQARAGADGRYELALPPGDYVAVASAVGRLRGAATPVGLGADRTLDVPVGPGGAVTLDIGELRGGERRPVPAKVSFLGVGVEAPDPRLGPDPTEDERNGVHAVALSPDGRGRLLVKPGRYDVVVSRGLEYELARLRVDVPQGGSAEVKADLERVVDTTGWLSGDYHQHSQGSIDSPVPIEARVVEDLAEGVELPAATDHDNVTDYRPHIRRLGAEAFINAVPGDELSVNGVGHFNAYPLAVDARDPLAKVGVKLWAGLSPPEMARRLRAGEPQDIIVHISHPRSKNLAGYFNWVRFDPTTGEGIEPLRSFDAVEVNGALGKPEDFLPASDAALHRQAAGSGASAIPALRDWFALLNLGQPTCALGNSDTHQRNGGTGYPRNYVRLGTDEPSAVDGARLVQALRRQQVVVSGGPFVTATLEGRAALGREEVVTLRGPEGATLGVRVQAPSWIDVATLEVYESGRPVPLARTGPGRYEQTEAGAPGAAYAAPIAKEEARGALRLDGEVRLRPARDGWYVVVVRGGGSLAPVAGGAPYGYTNPIYFDRAGDGWQAPGL